MENCLQQVTKKLLSKGYISKEDADVFANELDSAIKNAKEYATEMLKGDVEFHKNILSNGISEEELINTYVDNLIDVDVIKTSLKMAVADRQRAIREIVFNDMAQRGMINSFTGLLERSNNMNNRLIANSIFKNGLHTFAQRVQLSHNENLNDFYFGSVVETGDGRQINLKTFTQGEEEKEMFRKFLINDSLDGIEGENKIFLEKVLDSEKRLEKLMVSAFGESFNLREVIKDNVIKKIVKEEKRIFLRNLKANSVSRGSSRFLVGDNFEAGNNLVDWKNHLVEYVKNNLLNEKFVIDEEFRTGEIDLDKFDEFAKKVIGDNKFKSFKKKIERAVSDDKDVTELIEAYRKFVIKKSDMIAEDIALKLDPELYVYRKGDIVDRKVSDGLFTFTSYKDYINENYKELYKQYDFDVLESYKDTINTVSRKYAMLKTFGNEPKKTFRNSLNKLRKIGYESHAGYATLSTKFEKDFGKYLDYELGEGVLPSSLTRRAVDNFLAYTSSGGLVFVGTVQVGDVSRLVINSNALMKYKVSNTLKATSYIKEIKDSIVRKIKNDGVIESDKELFALYRVAQLHAVNTISDRNINFINTDKDLYKQKIKNSYKETGVGGAMLEATLPASFMDIHGGAMGEMSIHIAEDVFKEMNTWAEESAFKKNMLSASGFNEKTYNSFVDIVKDKVDGNTNFSKVIDSLTDEELEKMFTEFSENDIGMIIDMAENKAKFINPFIDRNGTGALNKKGVKKLFERIDDYYSEKTQKLQYRNWVDTLRKNKKIDKIKDVVRFETVTGFDMRVRIKDKEFYNLFIDENFKKDILDYIGYSSDDIDLALVRLKEVVERDMNVAYKDMIKEHVEVSVERAVKNVDGEKTKLLDYRLKLMLDEKSKNIMLKKFKSELKNRVENFKIAVADISSGQNPTIWEKMITETNDWEYTMLKMTRYFKNSLLRSTRGLLDVALFSVGDIMEKGKKEIWSKISEIGFDCATAVTFGGLSFLIQDSLDLEMDKTEELRDNGWVKATGTLLNEGTFVGTGLSSSTKPLLLIRDLGRTPSRILEEYEERSGEGLGGFAEATGASAVRVAEPFGKAWISPRVVEAGEGAQAIYEYVIGE